MLCFSSLLQVSGGRARSWGYKGVWVLATDLSSSKQSWHFGETAPRVRPSETVQLAVQVWLSTRDSRATLDIRRRVPKREGPLGEREKGTRRADSSFHFSKNMQHKLLHIFVMQRTWGGDVSMRTAMIIFDLDSGTVFVNAKFAEKFSGSLLTEIQ